MSPETFLTISQKSLELIVLLTMVLLLPALAVGLIVSLFQAATQINESTLSFVPKLLVTFAVLVLAGPWITQKLMDFTIQLFDSIPAIIGYGLG